MSKRLDKIDAELVSIIAMVDLDELLLEDRKQDHQQGQNGLQPGVHHTVSRAVGGFDPEMMAAMSDMFSDNNT